MVIKVTCRPKPNGNARIIMDLSAPRGRSVNDCIPDDVYPTPMGGYRNFWYRNFWKQSTFVAMVRNFAKLTGIMPTSIFQSVRRTSFSNGSKY
jgi:hypothetical protein